LIASPEDGMYLHLPHQTAQSMANVTAKEVDINDEYQIASIKSVIYDQEEKFYYVLSNKFEEKLGFFVIKVSEKDPSDKRFLIKWKNKLDIGDPNMFILRNYESKLKELIVSYKTIYINTYNVICMDVSVEDDQLMIFRHESF
jgi:hypothetical protein